MSSTRGASNSKKPRASIEPPGQDEMSKPNDGKAGSQTPQAVTAPLDGMEACMERMMKRMGEMETRLGKKVDDRIGTSETQFENSVKSSLGRVELRISTLEQKVDERMDGALDAIGSLEDRVEKN